MLRGSRSSGSGCRCALVSERAGRTGRRCTPAPAAITRRPRAASAATSATAARTANRMPPMAGERGEHHDAWTMSGCSGRPLNSMPDNVIRRLEPASGVGIACAHAAQQPRPTTPTTCGSPTCWPTTPTRITTDPLQGARPARDEQARPDAGHRRRPGRRGGASGARCRGPGSRDAVHRRGAGHAPATASGAG